MKPFVAVHFFLKKNGGWSFLVNGFWVSFCLLLKSFKWFRNPHCMLFGICMKSVCSVIFVHVFWNQVAFSNSFGERFVFIHWTKLINVFKSLPIFSFAYMGFYYRCHAISSRVRGFSVPSYHSVHVTIQILKLHYHGDPVWVSFASWPVILFPPK